LDVLVIVTKKFWKKLGEKYQKILEIKKESGLNLDLEIYDKETFRDSYHLNISLIYQLKDMKVIYGNLKLPSKIEIPKIELRMKADYSILDGEATGLEIYRAIRNLILINLIISKKIDNKQLIKSLYDEIGIVLANNLKSSRESAIERRIALLHLKRLLDFTLKNLQEAKWEKIKLLSH